MSHDDERPFRVGGILLNGLRARLVRGVGWNFVATVFTQGGTFALNITLANLWGLQRFGQYAIVQSTVATLTALAQPTTGTTATKYVAEFRAHDPLRASRILGLCAIVSAAIALVAGAALVVGSGAIAERILNEPTLSNALLIAGVAVFFNILSSTISGALAGLESYPAIGRAGILTGTLYFGISASLAWAWGLMGAVTGLAVSALIQWAVLLTAFLSEAARHGIRIAPREGWKELAIFFRYVTPAAFNSLMAFPAIWLANAMLVRQVDGYQQMALFSAANSFRLLVLFVPAIVNNVTLSLLNSQRGAADERRYKRIFWTNLAAVGGIIAVGASTVVAAGPWLLGLFGNEFRAAYPALLIMMIAVLPEALATVILQIIQSRERMWLSLVAVIVPCYSALLVVAWVVTPERGARGLAWSYVAAMTVALVASIVVVNRVGLWESRLEHRGTQ